MFTFKIDPSTKDLVFDGQNNITLVADTNEEDQSVRTVLGTNKGEWFLNTDLGLDYSLLQVNNPDLDIIRQELYEAILQDSRVSTVDSLEVNFSSSLRTLSITFTATMADSSTITVSNEVINA
jgi:hypothetical protein